MGDDVHGMPNVRAYAGPILWILSVQYFVVQVVVASRFRSGYAWSANTISDLGNTRCAGYGGRPVCSPLHSVMNVSFVVLGLTMFVGAVLLGGLLSGGSRTVTAGFACMGLAGLGTIVVGLFPENTVGGLHQAGAALPFVIGNVGVLVLGGSLGRLPRSLRTATLALGVLGLGGLGLFLSHTYLGLGTGGMERVTAYPQTVWLIAVGGYLLGRAGRRAVDAGSSRAA